MAISFISKKNRNRKRHIINDINITPFVDVLLVLLIIFMVASPMLTSSVNVTLPQGSSEPIKEKTQPIIISINNEGSIFLQDDSVKISSINKEIIKITNNDFESKIFIRADKSLDYGRVMEVLKTLNIGGFKNVMLVTELANQ